MCRPVKENFPFVEVRFNRQQAGNRKAGKWGRTSGYRRSGLYGVTDVFCLMKRPISERDLSFFGPIILINILLHR